MKRSLSDDGMAGGGGGDLMETRPQTDTRKQAGSSAPVRNYTYQSDDPTPLTAVSRCVFMLFERFFLKNS